MVLNFDNIGTSPTLECLEVFVGYWSPCDGSGPRAPHEGGLQDTVTAGAALQARPPPTRGLPSRPRMGHIGSGGRGGLGRLSLEGAAT